MPNDRDKALPPLTEAEILAALEGGKSLIQGLGRFLGVWNRKSQELTVLDGVILDARSSNVVETMVIRCTIRIRIADDVPDEIDVYEITPAAELEEERGLRARYGFGSRTIHDDPRKRRNDGDDRD